MVDMHPDDRPKLIAGALIGLPFVCWLLTATWICDHTAGQRPHLFQLAFATIHGREPLLLVTPILGLAAAIAGIVLAHHLAASDVEGAPFRRIWRGAAVATASGLTRRTTEKGASQITVAGVPFPTDAETLHLAITGATGAGKTVLFREMILAALLRGDRIIVADPNGEMASKFYRKGDVILNPYDARTPGWSIFNELRKDYDFVRYALSVIPLGQTNEAEEWCAYARLLVAEIARKLVLSGSESIRELHRWATVVSPEELRDFLRGTPAESLTVAGSDRALGSARFILGSKLPPHLAMPQGSFSLRSWLENPKGGNLFITWREDMAVTLRPLISAWVDALLTSLLSFSEPVPVWMFLDELASLEKLASIRDGITKGRKHGLRVVAGIQSTAQLREVYGPQGSQTILSCFRSLVVLGGACADTLTTEEMSKALGEREVERAAYGSSSNLKGNSSSSQYQRIRERIVLPSDIARLPPLTGYLSFTGGLPVAKVKMKYLAYKARAAAIEERP